MPDDSDGLSIPSTDNWDEWTFEQALKALTGEGADLHAAAKATWFNFNPSPSASDQIVYHAWGDYFYGVNVNNDAVTAWTQAVNTIDEMMPDVARGKRGSMDLQTLRDLEGAIRDFGGWAQAVGAGMTLWSNRLDSDDSSFRGKAAFLIYWRLKANGDGLNDTYEQVNSRHGRPIADAVGDAADELANFNSTMSGHWNTAITLNLRDWINNSLVSEINAVHQYAVDSGIQVGVPGYKLDAFGKDVEDGKAFIRTVLQNYPKGDLTSASGWQKIGDSITQTALENLKNLLDLPAQTAISTLAPKYVLATSSLIEITPPPTETPPQPDTSTGGGPDGGDDTNLPPPPGGGGGDDTNLPPPPGGGGDGGGDIPPPDGSGGGGGDIPPPDGSGGGDIPPPDGTGAGGGDIPPPDGSGGGDVPPPDGSGAGGDGLDLPGAGGGADGGPNVPGGGGPPADGGGNGAFVPSLVPPGSGAGGNGTGGGSGAGPGGDGAFDENPGGDGAFDENPGGDGVITPPDGGVGGGPGGSLLSPGADRSGTVVPPGGGADGTGESGTGARVGAGAGGGADGSGGVKGGFGSDPGKNFDPGGGLGGGQSGLGSGAGGGLGGAGGGVGGGLGGVGGGADGGLGGGIGGAGGAGGGLGGVGVGAGGGLGGPGGGLGGASGFGGAGLGNAGLNGGPGGLLAGAPAQLTGGSPGVNGAPGSSGTGGVPFFPPMMGGAGAGGEKPQERERQTWLSEDEEIWGTRVDVGSGVIGRLDEEEFEAEEIPLAGPSRRPRPDTRRRRHTEDEKRREETRAPGEQSGSASAT